MDKRGLSNRDTCPKIITPALQRAGWNTMSQICEEVFFTKGRTIVRGKARRADYILCYGEDFDLTLALHESTRLVAQRISSRQRLCGRTSTLTS